VPTDPYYQAVFVRDCGGKFVNVYADKAKTIQMPNPFLADADGSYKVYTQGGCLEVTVGGKLGQQ